MKNTILFILLFCITCGHTKIQAQARCEFDSLYGCFGYEKTEGRKVIQLSDKNILIAGTTYHSYSGDPIKYIPYFVKINNCGNTIWTYLDTATNTYLFVDDTKIIEEQDATITLLINGSRLIKLESYGIKKWEVTVGDSTNYLNTYNFIKLRTNRYLFAGSKANKASILLTDSLGNSLLQKSYFINANANSYIQQVYKKSLNEINLIGFEGSSLFKLTIDSIGNLQNSNYTVVFNGFSPQKSACYNFDSTEILYSSLLVNPTYRMYLARYSSNGIKIKDSILSYLVYQLHELSPAPNNTTVILSENNVIRVDTGFKIIWKDTVLSGNQGLWDYTNYHSLFTNDSSVFTTGSYHTCNGPPSSCHTYIHVKKSFTFNYVKTLAISGLIYINTNGGQTQLYAIITPADVSNKQVYWNVSDWSKAIIDSNGLVTAKANGIVKVTATSADNSLATAFINITISNQSIGLDEALSKSLASVFPNPANQSINISFQSSNTNPTFELYDVKGMLIKNSRFDKINEELYKLDLINLPEGMYILSIGINEMKQYQKVMVVK